MDIIPFHSHTSFLKPFFNDFVTTYLEKYYLESVQIVSARILMRSLFELMILIKKLHNEREEFIRFSKAYEKFKIIEADKIILENIEDPYYASLFSKQELEDSINEAESEITNLGFLPTWNKQNGKPKVMDYFEIKQMASDVDLESEYKTAYKNLCLDTHTSSGHFYKYFLKDSSGNKLLNLHPYLHELDLMIFIVIGFLSDFFWLAEDLLGISTQKIAVIQYKKLWKLGLSQIPSLTTQGLLKKQGWA